MGSTPNARMKSFFFFGHLCRNGLADIQTVNGDFSVVILPGRQGPRKQAHKREEGVPRRPRRQPHVAGYKTGPQWHPGIECTPRDVDASDNRLLKQTEARAEQCSDRRSRSSRRQKAQTRPGCGNNCHDRRRKVGRNETRRARTKERQTTPPGRQRPAKLDLYYLRPACNSTAHNSDDNTTGSLTGLMKLFRTLKLDNVA